MRDESAAALATAAKLLQQNLERLAEAMKTDDEKFKKEHSDQAQRLARSAAALGAEVRKHGDDVEESAKKKTPEQRAEIAERWLARLPKPLLKPIVERLAAALKAS